MRETINQLVILTLIGILFYAFFNGIILNRFILAKAYSEQLKQNYSTAITYYEMADSYYKWDHFSKENKKRYFEVPYKIALCYLGKKDKPKAVQVMLDELVTVQTDYGLFSKENAYFIRKYLIDFYLINNYPQLANREYKNLTFIYKSIGYDNDSIADMARVMGDLYYHQKQYETAMDFYRKAYNSISGLKEIDYETFLKIVSRIGEFEVKSERKDNAISFYTDALEIINKKTNSDNEYKAELLLKLGDLYRENDKDIKKALACYEEAVKIIKSNAGSTYTRQNLSKYLTTLKELYDKDNQYTKSRETELELARMRRFSFVF